MKRVVLFVAIGAALAGVYLLVIGRRGGEPSDRFVAPRHVLLITVDTLRADRVGCYGHAPARTPTLDALARRGTRFTRAYAPAPITLTSHATMMTGRHPPGHGARHNGMAMRADVPTIAEAFQQAGFETAAFVSAFPLDRRFGLTRGFTHYDDELPRGANGRRAIERPGVVSVDHAITWIHGRSAGARLFVWLHLFEPHAPYGTPGSAPGRDASDRYDDEVATADAAAGRLLNAWPDLTNTLVVATADHGESFGEHGEIGHSIFVYDTTLRVPLIVAGPGVPAGGFVAEPVALVDLAPTIAAFVDAGVVGGDGIDLRPAMAGPLMAETATGRRALYAESFAPLLDFGWAPLRSIRRDGLKLIAGPRPELYDVAADAGENRNVIADRARAAGELGVVVDAISPPDLPAGERHVSPDALARLRALGYAAGSRSPGGTRPDPKDRIGIASRLLSVTSGELQGAAAEEALRQVLREDPGNPQAQQRLGFILAETGRCQEAERHFADAIASTLPSADPHLGLALCQSQRGAIEASLATLQDARRIEPGNPVVEANIGLTSLQLGRVDVAIMSLSTALATDPDLHQARFALARAYGRRGDRDAALRESTELLRRLPPSAPQRPEVERLIAALR